MKLAELRTGSYIKVADIDKPLQVTVERIEADQNVSPPGEPEKKRAVLFFKGISRGLVLNAEVLDSVVAVLGTEPDDWIGQRAELFIDNRVSFNGKRGGVRVRRVQSAKTPKNFDEAERELDALRSAEAEERESMDERP